MLELEEYFSRQVEKMAQLQVLCPLLFLESSLLESRGAAGGLLCGCCGHFSQLRSLSPRWQRTCCATIFSVEPLCSFSALAAVVPVSRCHKPDWHSPGTQTWETVKKPQGKCCSAEEGSPEGEQKEPRRPTGHSNQLECFLGGGTKGSGLSCLVFTDSAEGLRHLEGKGLCCVPSKEGLPEAGLQLWQEMVMLRSFSMCLFRARASLV
ncbi:uncharacterized protein LOC125684327 [Lagopus muta]|uniref:uncharacterized protein LOC125684327 n=1 Tax=Lagopus muta TaxID=64668 RepID=UPI00209CCA9A|nr:uncharacterized protein LOC125684327 [Lagopus muta]